MNCRDCGAYVFGFNGTQSLADLYKLENENLQEHAEETKTATLEELVPVEAWTYGNLLSKDVYMLIAIGSIASVGLFIATTRWRSSSADSEHIA